MHPNHYTSQMDAQSAQASEIESAFQNLAGNIEALHDALGSLEVRIGSILLPQAPAGEDKAGGPSPVAIESSMLYSINMLKQRVIEANNRISSMLNRAQT